MHKPMCIGLSEKGIELSTPAQKDRPGEVVMTESVNKSKKAKMKKSTELPLKSDSDSDRTIGVVKHKVIISNRVLIKFYLINLL
jgi:hypothetical protein